MSTTVNFKLPFGSAFTRFSLSADSPSELFAALNSKLESLGLTSNSLSYVDTDGDNCLLTTIDELEAAIEHCGDAAILLATEKRRNRDRARSRSHSRSHSRRAKDRSSSSSSSSSSLSSSSESDDGHIKSGRGGFGSKKMKKLHKKMKKNGVRLNHPFGLHRHLQNKKMYKLHKKLGFPAFGPRSFGPFDPRASLGRGPCGGRGGFGAFGRGGFSGRGGFGSFSHRGPFDRFGSCSRRPEWGYGERLGGFDHPFGGRGGFGGFGRGGMRGFHHDRRPDFGGFGRRHRRFSDGEF